MSFVMLMLFGLILQDPLGDEAVEELDEGSEAERADEGAQTHETAQEPAEQGAEGVGKDAAAEVLEVRVVPQAQREVIVGRDAEVSRLVKGRAQRRHKDGQHHPHQLFRQGRCRAEGRGNGLVEEGYDEPHADAVDEGAKADVLAPEPEFQRKEEDVGGDVLHAQRDAQQLGKAHIQRADGVVAEMGLLEEGDAQTNNDNAHHHAHDAAGGRLWVVEVLMRNGLLIYFSLL